MIWLIVLGLFYGYASLKHNRVITILIILLTIFLVIAASLFDVNKSVDYSMLVIYTGGIFLLYQGRKFDLFTTLIIFMILEMLLQIIIFLSFDKLNINNWLIKEVVTFIVVIIMTIGLLKIVNKFDYHKLPRTNKTYLLLIIMGILLVVISGKYQLLYHISDNFDVFIVVILLLMIFSYIALYDTMVKLGLKNDLDTSRGNEKNVIEKYQLLDQQYQTNFYFLHDLLKKCQRLNQLVEVKDYRLLKEEINNLADDTYRQFNNIYSQLSILNLLINERRDLMVQYDINVVPTITYHDFSFIRITDLMIIFDQLLDIVFNLVINYDKRRFIFIKTFKKENQVIIQFKVTSNKKQLDNLFDQKFLGLISKYQGLLSNTNIDEETISLMVLFFR